MAQNSFILRVDRMPDVSRAAKYLALTWEKEVVNDDRFVRVTFLPVTAPDPAGYTFAGSFQGSAGGERNHIFTPLGYPDLPDHYAHALPLCDQTGRTLRRQRFYVLRRTSDGAWFQVSQMGLADFLDDPVAASLLSWWVEQYRAFLLTIREATPLLGRTHFSVAEVIEAALEVIHLRGWVSRGQAHKHGDIATASLVTDLLEYGEEQPSKELTRLSDQIEEFRETESLVVEAQEIVEWLSRLHANESEDHRLTDYLHNLALVASQEFVEARHVGILCSAPMAYNEWKRVQEAHKETPPIDPGHYFGQPDTRMEATIHVDQIENRGENEYGVSLLVHMHVVPTGERLKWWTGEGLKLDEGKDYRVRMSIKKHGEWDGRRETTVSRVTDMDAPKKPRKPREEATGGDRGDRE